MKITQMIMIKRTEEGIICLEMMPILQDKIERESVAISGG